MTDTYDRHSLLLHRLTGRQTWDEGYDTHTYMCEMGYDTHTYMRRACVDACVLCHVSSSSYDTHTYMRRTCRCMYVYHTYEEEDTCVVI